VPIRGRTIRKAAIVAIVLASGVVACTNKKESIQPHIASLDAIERQLGHKVARPGATLGAKLIRSGLLESSGSTFAGGTAVASYRWRDHIVLIRQGHPASGWSLHGSILRSDAAFTSRADGSEVALTPQVAGSSASGYVVSGAWLVEVEVAPRTAKGPVPFGDLRAFVDGLEL